MKLLYEAFGQRRFLVVSVLMAVVALAMHPVARATHAWASKRAVPIKKPMREFDAAALKGFRFQGEVSRELAPVTETDQYLEWSLRPEGPRKGSHSEVAYLQIYYFTGSGSVSQIPHTPEVCYRQGGNQVTAIGDVEISVPGLAPGVDSVAAKYVRMSHPTERKNRDFVVVYVFCVNGRFYDDREKARWILALPWNRAVYFAKIECATRITHSDGLRDALETCQSVLGDAIRELVERHFPGQTDIEDALR